MSDFDWSVETEFVVRPSVATVVYQNDDNDIVIRQQGEWAHGEDQVVVIPRDRVSALIKALQDA